MYVKTLMIRHNNDINGSKIIKWLDEPPSFKLRAVIRMACSHHVYLTNNANALSRFSKEHSAAQPLSLCGRNPAMLHSRSITTMIIYFVCKYS